VVDAFLAAARAGDFEALLRVLDPDVVFRVDQGTLRQAVRPAMIGAETVARRILARGTPLAPLARPAVVNGAAGAIIGPPGAPIAVVGFAVAQGRIVSIDLITNREKLQRLRGK